MSMSQLTLYNAETEVTARHQPQPLAIRWSGWPQGGKVTARPLPQPLSIEWRGWPQAGRGPTDLGRLRLSHIGSPVGLFRCQLKFLTVRSLKRAVQKCLGLNLGDSWNTPDEQGRAERG